MKKIILGVVLGLVISASGVAVAAALPVVKSMNSTATTKIIFNEQKQYITRIDDAGISCYIYTVQAGPALTCVKR